METSAKRKINLGWKKNVTGIFTTLSRNVLKETRRRKELVKTHRCFTP